MCPILSHTPCGHRVMDGDGLGRDEVDKLAPIGQTHAATDVDRQEMRGRFTATCRKDGQRNEILISMLQLPFLSHLSLTTGPTVHRPSSLGEKLFPLLYIGQVFFLFVPTYKILKSDLNSLVFSFLQSLPHPYNAPPTPTPKSPHCRPTPPFSVHLRRLLPLDPWPPVSRQVSYRLVRFLCLPNSTRRRLSFVIRIRRPTNQHCHLQVGVPLLNL